MSVAAIKRTPADVAFSLCVRERAGWKCQRCGGEHFKGGVGLHCSHHHRRGQWAVRFDPLNAEALCYGCHSYIGGTRDRMDEVLTEAEQALLRERKEDAGLARMYRRTQGKGEIAKHYRDEYQRMLALRADGVTGRIKFDAFF